MSHRTGIDGTFASKVTFDQQTLSHFTSSDEENSRMMRQQVVQLHQSLQSYGIDIEMKIVQCQLEGITQIPDRSTGERWMSQGQ